MESVAADAGDSPRKGVAGRLTLPGDDGVPFLNSFFSTRRIVGLGTVALLAVASHQTAAEFDRNLHRGDYVTGYSLIVALFLLTSLHWRKQMPVASVGPVVWWIQAHLYLGLFSGFLLGEHLAWRWPDGSVELSLFGLFIAVWGSGVLGLIWTRRIPPRLAKLREEYLYDQLPELRQRTAADAHALVTGLLRHAPNSTVGEFYSHSLLPFFHRPVPWRQYVWCTSRTRNRLQNELSALWRYGSSTEREVQEQLARLVDRRDDLNFHQVQQGRLKGWLCWHIALTYPLVLLAVFHGVLAQAFQGT